MKVEKFEKYQYRKDKEMLEEFLEDYGYALLGEYYDGAKEVDDYRNNLLANGLHLNSHIAPRLYNILEEIKTKLGIDIDVEFFLQNTAAENAYSISSRKNGKNLIIIEAAIIRLLTDEELHFVIGHELGHIIFDHSRLIFPTINLMQNEEKTGNVSQDFANKMLRWSRASEISADRIGFLACSNFKAAANAFFKMATGLDSSYLNFDIDGFVSQIFKIKDNQGFTDMDLSTHPASPMRILALKYFSESKLYDPQKTLSEDELTEKVDELLFLHEKIPTDKDKVDELYFFSSAALMVAAADGEISGDEHSYILEAMYDDTTYPQAFVDFKDMDEVRSVFEKKVKILKKSRTDKKFELFKVLVFVAIADGNLKKEESDMLSYIAQKLGIPEEYSKLIVKEICDQWLIPKSKKSQILVDNRSLTKNKEEKK